MVPELDREKSQTWSVNVVVCETLPPVPVTVIAKEPVGVEDVVLMVSVLEKVRVPLAGLTLHEAPVGSPAVHERVML